MSILRPIGYRAALLLVLICIGSSPIWCQNHNVQDHLNAAYRGKLLLLRNFYTGNDLGYDQDGVLRAGAVTQGPWTLAGVEITSLAVTAQGVEILGNRQALLYSHGKQGVVKLGKLRIHVARPISDVDNETVLDPILTKVFIRPEEEDLKPMVPVFWRSYLAGTDSKSRAAAWQNALQENGVSTVKAAHDPAGKPTPPRAISTPDPKYTKEAASHHIEGTTSLGIVVDTTGTPVGTAILEPLGMGLDEQAVLAVSQWKFQPATLNGNPVKVQINLQIEFKCCP